MHVGMYDCMRSASESELDNQLSGHTQLKGVRVISACYGVSACWHYFANLSTVSVCLPVHTVTQNKHKPH